MNLFILLRHPRGPKQISLRPVRGPVSGDVQGHGVHQGSNTYIAGHRMGYFGTDSFLAFFRLNELDPADEISLGREYAYRVRQQVVGPEDVGVMDPVAGRSAISLRTRPLPDKSWSRLSASHKPPYLRRERAL
jgi:hypothetical protein